MGKISQFISDLISKELHNKEAALLQAYQEAYHSPTRKLMSGTCLIPTQKKTRLTIKAIDYTTNHS
jgi:hypothetical protein